VYDLVESDGAVYTDFGGDAARIFVTA